MSGERDYLVRVADIRHGERPGGSRQWMRVVPASRLQEARRELRYIVDWIKASESYAITAGKSAIRARVNRLDAALTDTSEGER